MVGRSAPKRAGKRAGKLGTPTPRRGVPRCAGSLRVGVPGHSVCEPSARARGGGGVGGCVCVCVKMCYKPEKPLVIQRSTPVLTE